MNNQLPPGITQEMIDQAKAKFGQTGKVKLVMLQDKYGNDLVEVLMARPTMTVIDQWERNLAEPATADEVMINGCLLSHKDEVKANDVKLAAAITAIAELLPFSKPQIRPLQVNALPAGITEDMVSMAKEAAGDRIVEIAWLQQSEDTEDLLPVLICSPTRKAVSEHEKWDSRNPKKAKGCIIDSSILSHKDTVKGNDWLFFAAYAGGISLKPKGSAVIKNC